MFSKSTKITSWRHFVVFKVNLVHIQRIFYYSFIANLKHISASRFIPILANKYVHRAEKTYLTFMHPKSSILSEQLCKNASLDLG